MVPEAVAILAPPVATLAPPGALDIAAPPAGMLPVAPGILAEPGILIKPDKPCAVALLGFIMDPKSIILGCMPPDMAAIPGGSAVAAGTCIGTPLV